MKITCQCGNSFNFGKPKDNKMRDMKGFELSIIEDTDEILLQCNKCGEGIIFHSNDMEEE